jgi:EpsI family protein
MDSNELVMSAGRRGDGWLLGGVFVILLVLYAATVMSFYNVYSDEGAGQSHAPLLLLVSLYLLYRTWSLSGREIHLQFNHLATLLLVALSLLWMVLGLVFVEAGQQAALILIVATTAIGMLGWHNGARYLMPILLLITVVPVWSLAIPYLQIASAQASAVALDLIGITSIREGYLLVIPNGTFEVADACSGLKFQVVGVTLALIHSQLIKVPFRVMLIYAALASLLAFISNTLRIVVVVIIGNAYGLDNEYVQDHNFIGWILFSIFFFLFLFWGERKLRMKEIPLRPVVVEPGQSRQLFHQLPGVGLVLFAISIGPGLYGYFSHRASNSAGDQLDALTEIPDWHFSSADLSDWKPIWTRGQHTLEGHLQKQNEVVDLFATEFSRQRQGHEAVNVSHRVYDLEKWSRISRSDRVVTVSGVGSVTIEETLLKSPGQRKRLVWQWYRTNDKITASNMSAKLNNLAGVLSGKPDIAVVVLSKEIIRNEAHAEGVLEAFLKAYLTLAGGGT